jgi:FlaA1/EpsC-like NDP-sugar epimerase
VGLVQGEKLHEDLVSELEIPYLYDLGDFYVIKPKASATTLKKEHLTLSSNNAEFVSKDELTEIVNEYINNLPFLKQ